MKSCSRNCFRRLFLFAFFAGVGLAIGFAVPVVVEWGERPEIRSQIPTIETAALGTLLVTTIVCGFSFWMGRRTGVGLVEVATQPRKLQFGINGLFIAMTVAAFSIVVAGWFNESTTNAVVVFFAIGVVGWSWFRDWDVCARVGAMLGALFLPFVWMIAYNVPFGHASGLAVNIPIGPAIFPTALLAGLVGNQKFDEMLGMAAVLVCFQMLVGAWLAWRGGKLSVVYLIFLLLNSSVSSLVMHFLYRM